jgi:putative lipoprotein
MRAVFYSLLVANLALLAAALFPVAAMAETKTLSGTVAYRERIALPAGAIIEVKLIDVSLADAPAKTIAETTITPEGQVPVPYTLEYNASQIEPGRSYAVQARIMLSGQLLFINTKRHTVFGHGADKTDILVERVANRASSSPTGNWLAEDINGGGVIDRLQTILEIAEDGTVSGTGGCNRMNGKATIDGDKIKFGPIASTEMACAPAVMDQESKFFAALQKVRTWKIDPTRQKLALLDEDDRAVIVLTRL